jgi:hypothetical protein
VTLLMPTLQAAEAKAVSTRSRGERLAFWEVASSPLFSASSDDFAKRKKNQLRHKETDYLGPPSSSSLFLSFVASSHVSSRSLHDAASDGRHLLCARGGADRKGRRTRSR